MIFIKPVHFRKAAAPIGPDVMVWKLRVGAGNLSTALPWISNGTYNHTIDWGDGSPVGTVSTYNDSDAFHTYASPGDYDILIDGEATHIEYVGSPNISDYTQLIEILQWGDTNLQWIRNAFRLCTGLERSAAGLKLYGDYSLYRVYGNCSNLVSVGRMDPVADGLFSYYSRHIENCPLLTHLPNYPAGAFFENADRFCFNNTSLATVDYTGMFDNIPSNKNQFPNAFQNCSLMQDSVDGLLISVNNANNNNGIFDIAGGTNAAPGPAGLAAKSALESRGWTVNTN